MCQEDLTDEGLEKDNLEAMKKVKKEFDEFALKVQPLEHEMRKEAHKMATQQIMRTCVVMMLSIIERVDCLGCCRNRPHLQ